MRLSAVPLAMGLITFSALTAFGQDSSVPCPKRHCIKCVQVVGGSSWCPQFIPQPVAPASPTPVASPILPGAGQPVSKRQLHLYNASPDLEKKIRELIQQGY
jgi:hypothetical protein